MHARTLLLLVAAALVACVAVAAAADEDTTTTTTAAPSSLPALDFKHDNVRCTCSCPEQTVITNATGEGNECVQTRHNYDMVLGSNRRLAQETCKECVFSRGQRRTNQCSYIVVMDDEEQCLCQNILPSLGENNTKHHKNDCEYGMCICTYEFRNQNLIKGIVIFYFVILGLLLSVTAFNLFPHRLFTLHSYGLSLRDPDMPLPKLYSPRTSRSTSPTGESRHSFVARFQRMLKWDTLRRQPRVRDIGY
eukprot:m.143550 g.143550  ORF g.143550 m.143550 type:complete len:249 (-) comp16742_c2_seq4:50-796(-)